MGVCMCKRERAMYVRGVLTRCGSLLGSVTNMQYSIIKIIEEIQWIWIETILCDLIISTQ